MLAQWVCVFDSEMQSAVIFGTHFGCNASKSEQCFPSNILSTMQNVEDRIYKCKNQNYEWILSKFNVINIDI